MASLPTVLFVGTAAHGEFAPAVQWLRRYADPSFEPSVAAAIESLQETGPYPGTIVLGESRRGEHAEEEVLQLMRLLPLARTIRLIGSWCEGETRSDKPMDGWSRVYWHQFAGRAPVEFFPGLGSIHAGSIVGERHFPKTMTETEKSLARSRGPLPSGSGCLAINTVHCVDYEALAEAIGEAGYEALWCQSADTTAMGKATCVLWDRWGLQESDLCELVAWRTTWDQLPLIAMIGFPREQDYRLVSDGTVQAIVGKPFLLRELLYVLKQVTGRELDMEKAA